MNIINKITSFLPTFSARSEAASPVPTETVKADHLAKQTLEAKGNGDFVLTSGRSFLYCLVDFIGGGRQVAATVQASSMLLSHTANAISNVAGAIIPFGLLLTGPLVMGSVAAWAIPDSHAALKSAREELKEAGKDTVLVKEAKHAISIAKLGVANMYLAFGMGLTQTASGVVMMLTPDVARVFHYAPVLSGHAAAIGLAVTNVALGAVYTLRGAVMVCRTIQSYIPVVKLRDKFKEALKESPHNALAFLKEEESHGSTYFERRVDPNSLELLDKEGNTIGKYTSEGLVDGKGKVIDDSALAKREYLRRVDKGIYTQLLKHRVALVIGGAMILGGITAIVLSVMTGGTLPIIIGLASAIFFISMEYLFLVYDSTGFFNKLRDWTYKPSPELANLEDTLQEDYWLYRQVAKLFSLKAA